MTATLAHPFRVAAYVLSWLFLPFFYLLIDLAHPIPVINVV